MHMAIHIELKASLQSTCVFSIAYTKQMHELIFRAFLVIIMQFSLGKNDKNNKFDYGKEMESSIVCITGLPVLQSTLLCIIDVMSCEHFQTLEGGHYQYTVVFFV